MACPSYDDLKISPQPISLKIQKNLSRSQKYDNYGKTTYSLPLLLVTLGKPVQHAIHYPMANFEPIFDQEPGTKVWV